ncbi:MAG: [protein-PII] uridylyltransferase [Xanthomonadales bacterium]|nr:[protein-PII] uridylyltransferase [Xanthomonadales bacterium]NIN59526.1 [protein-PII] uridylyltransferase [Xanthomonadales bacterium]NIN74892.1 [protein-PII] uridylyltransferase [Xanthomonadales bacterium]NIO14034.1 [protein-PII] uridylyltransferase [Xanthomonadales bacterium]NIP11919.1 [protein-PII] uridylyltransferase [Xanthomonadales bacterium]
MTPRPVPRLDRLPAPGFAVELLPPDAVPDAGVDRAALTQGLRDALHAGDGELARRFWAGESVEGLVGARAWLAEQLVLSAWAVVMPEDDGLALAAVGGFGRGQLHPGSDIDLLVVLGTSPPDPETTTAIETFVALLWDAGFYLGHSVRSVGECVAEARADVATATNLMEARCIAGSARLFRDMQAATGAGQLWPAGPFFEAKYQEQLERHARFHDTAYNLEPNVKEGPGGLRDIQMIAWVTQRHFGTRTLHALVEHGFLTEPEYGELREGQAFLWRVRFALHLLAGRAEDRLLFDFQRQVAERFGFARGVDAHIAVERFMQRYYRVVMQLERLNERLLQLFREELLPGAEAPTEPADGQFRIINGYLEVSDEQLFTRRPAAIMELFLLLARREELLGVRAATVRLICDHLHLIDERFRSDPEVLAAFLQLLRQRQGVYTQLQRMNRYGVLAAFLPAFALITGRMQFDLFHVYTVDQHILFSVRNLRRFAYGKYREYFRHAPRVFRTIDRPELLYLAALFHDIAKGREGDHSDLGADEARRFCARLPLEAAQAERVAWLVQHHLLMSQTAQRKDINDPEIVHRFAMQVGDQDHLDYLYVLTVADIAATSPKLWNSWKDGLLWELYCSASEVLRQGGAGPPDPRERAAAARQAAATALQEQAHAAPAVSALLDTLPASAFTRFLPEQLTWGAGCVLSAGPDAGVIIGVRERSEREVSEVLVSAPDYTGLFATTTAVFDEMGLNVLEARVVTTRDSRSFDLFQVMDARSRPLSPEDAADLQQRLVGKLGRQTVPRPVRRKLPRRLRPFVSAPEIRFTTARRGTVTSMEIECTDRPGLLSQLAAAMLSCEIRIHDAMIATFGDRAEDTFLLTGRDGSLLDAEQQARLEQAIIEHLRAEQ